MPSLRLLGQRRNLGSDDITVPATFEAILQGAWFATFGCIYYNLRRSHSLVACSGVENFYIMGLLLSGFNLSVLAASIHVSLAGTLVNPYPRRNMAKLTAAKLLLDILQFMFSVGGTYWIFYGEVPVACGGNIMSNVKTAVRCGWGLAIAALVGFAYVLNPQVISNGIKRPTDLEHDETVISTYTENWYERVKALGQLLGLDNHPALRSVAKLLTDFFREKVDLVPSDIFVGLILLEKDQQQRRQTFLQSRTLKPRTPSLILEDGSQGHVKVKSWMNPSLAAHYMTFAAGAYGWPYYVLNRPKAALGLLKVLGHSRYIPRALPSHVVGDSRLLVNTTVIKISSGLRDEDLVYVTFHNKLFEVPFYVALDHKHKAVVVAIRGTLSIEDVLVDLIAFESDPLSLDGVPDAQAHEGILQTAKYIMSRLTGTCDHRTLPAETGEIPILKQAYEKLSQTVGQTTAQEYGVVIVGHSLGAGVAAVLSVMMQQMEQYRDLKCFAYSPPGGLLSLSAAKHSEEFVCSVILGDDIVGRLGLQTVFDLKIKLFQVVKDCDMAKHEVFGGWFRRFVNRTLGVSRRSSITQFSQHSWNEDQNAWKCVEKFQHEMQQAIDRTLELTRGNIRMHLPGCVMYIEEHKGKGFFSKSHFSHLWVENTSPMFDEILLSGDMVAHHFPWTVCDALQSVAETVTT